MSSNLRFFFKQPAISLFLSSSLDIEPLCRIFQTSNLKNLWSSYYRISLLNIPEPFFLYSFLGPVQHLLFKSYDSNTKIPYTVHPGVDNLDEVYFASLILALFSFSLQVIYSRVSLGEFFFKKKVIFSSWL